MAKGLQGLFLALRHAAAATLLVLPACSDVALPSEDMPASGQDPGYNNLVANYLKNTFKKSRIIRRICNIGLPLGTLVQRLGLDDLCSFRG